MSMEDVRWRQRFETYVAALGLLERIVKSDHELNEAEELGLIKAYELCYEQAWLVLQDYLQDSGFSDLGGPTKALVKALEIGLISDHDKWFDLKDDRQRTVHTYNKEKAETIAQHIVDSYYFLYINLKEVLEKQLYGN